MFVYVGTYTEEPEGHADGIYVYLFDAESGALTHVQTVAGIANPSFLATDAQQHHLYSVNELTDGRVSAFARDRQSGELRLLNSQSSHGAAPCYVSLDSSSRYALVANYTGGTLAVLPIAEDGLLRPASDVVRRQGSGPNERRQEASHPHMIAPAPEGGAILATDLGTDSVLIYQLDANGRLVPSDQQPAAAQPGAGPRHFAFSPDGRTLYVINELDSTLTAYAYDGDAGRLQARQTVSSLPDEFHGDTTTAQVVVAPDGRFIYGSNRGHDSIATWSVDQQTGELSAARNTPTGGKTPRNFNIDPTGTWLLAANETSDTIVTFRRDPDSGSISPTGHIAHVPSPVCILFCQP